MLGTLKKPKPPKVTAPHPINLPSRKSENSGQDPNINLVPSSSSGVWRGKPDTDSTQPTRSDSMQEHDNKDGSMISGNNLQANTASPPTISSWGKLYSQPTNTTPHETEQELQARQQGFHLQREEFPTLAKGMEASSPPRSDFIQRESPRTSPNGIMSRSPVDDRDYAGRGN
jgi:hypothetical protein